LITSLWFYGKLLLSRTVLLLFQTTYILAHIQTPNITIVTTSITKQMQATREA
jgi:hypothetical protein